MRRISSGDTILPVKKAAKLSAFLHVGILSSSLVVFNSRARLGLESFLQSVVP